MDVVWLLWLSLSSLAAWLAEDLVVVLALVHNNPHNLEEVVDRDASDVVVMEVLEVDLTCKRWVDKAVAVPAVVVLSTAEVVVPSADN